MPPARQRFSIPLRSSEFSESSPCDRSSPVLNISAFTVHGGLDGFMVAQLVSSESIRGRHILLFCGYGLRHRGHPRTFQQDASPSIHTTNNKLCLLCTTAAPAHSLSQTSTAAIQCAKWPLRTVSNEMATAAA